MDEFFPAVNKKTADYSNLTTDRIHYWRIKGWESSAEIKKRTKIRPATGKQTADLVEMFHLLKAFGLMHQNYRSSLIWQRSFYVCILLLS